MSDSEKFDALDEKHERNQQQRFAAIKRWAEYISDEPADVWGPQQNAVVNSQLESAQETALGAKHEQQVTEIAETLATGSKDDNSES